MFFKKKKEIEELKNQIKLYKQYLNRAREENNELKNHFEELKLDAYKEYDWAVLCKNYSLTIINNGRIEEKVRRVTVDSDTGMIPTITIEK